MHILCQLQPALQAASLQPLFAFQLPQLLLCLTLGISSTPLVIVKALVLKAGVVSFLHAQHSLEFANPAGVTILQCYGDNVCHSTSGMSLLHAWHSNVPGNPAQQVRHAQL